MTESGGRDGVRCANLAVFGSAGVLWRNFARGVNTLRSLGRRIPGRASRHFCATKLAGMAHCTFSLPFCDWCLLR
eukprot:2562366-Pyramimonas_sp.AAC.1